METRRITTIAELNTLAKDILSVTIPTEGASVIGLKGDLGAGKTAFTKELAKILNIQEEVTSPTFVIMKAYPIEGNEYFKTLSHIDAYRIESDDEMRVLRFDELLKDATQLVVIEWPEKIQNLMPKNTRNIEMTLQGDGSRDIAYNV